MIGTKLSKPRPLTGDTEYLECVIWCRQNNATIEDKGEYYEVVAIPEPALDEVKARKKQELTDARDAVEFQNVTTDKGTFAFDDLSQSRINRAKEAMTDLQTRNWTTVDKQVVVMYKADFQAISDASIVRSDIAFAKLNTLEEQVDNATTVEEVNAIRWEEV